MSPILALTNGIRLALLEVGPLNGPAVLLLHGFPEFSYSWRHQLPFLADLGYRVIAPDLRGYNLSDKPGSVKEYGIAYLVADIIGLMDQRGISKAIIVGHDWGGIIAWFAAMWHPGRVEKLVIMNAPQPAKYLLELRRPTQLLRSWYVGFFQIPWLPELVLRANHFAALRRLFRHGPARCSTSLEYDVQHYIDAVSKPGALTAMINYYRAAMREIGVTSRERIRRIDIPTLVIWGMQDRYLTPRLTEGLDEWVTDLRIERLPEATHWVQNDQPELVNNLLAQFVGNSSSLRLNDRLSGSGDMAVK